MALADRTYMRDDYNPPRYTTILIIVLIVAFVLEAAYLFYAPSQQVLGRLPPLLEYLGLSVDGLRHGRAWQLLTFQFLHAAPMPFHVLFNCLALYFFGRSVEETLGSRRFLGLYLLSGVLGGLLQVLTTIILPHHKDISVVGASAGVCGIIAIFCALYPMRELTAWLYFFPITIRARYLLWFVTGLSIYGTIIPFEAVAHAAHLGGILTGLAYVRWFHDSERLSGFSGFWRRLRPRRSRPIVKVRFPRGADDALPAEPGELGATDFISKEVDPILEKISAHGIHSLTDHEKKILQAARSKMEKP
jgi:membrane associated rhomboid family serine protease